jgi:hypothetical protein
VGYSYRLLIEEDLDKLGVPLPDDEAVASAWRTHAGDAPMPSEMAGHIRATLRQQWLEHHREERLPDALDAVRWAWDNLGWRLLLEDETVDRALKECGLPGLHEAFYSEGITDWFSAREALARLERIRATLTQRSMDEAVVDQLTAFERVVRNLAAYNLRFRFDFDP